jgi:hypothetical protein
LNLLGAAGKPGLAFVLVELLLKIILGVFGAGECRQRNSEFAVALGADGNRGRNGQPFRDSQNPWFHKISFPQATAGRDRGLWIFHWA